MPNLFDLITAMPRQQRIALVTWICRGLRLGPKEWAYVMGTSKTTMYNRRNYAD